jgi:hypothetical protein
VDKGAGPANRDAIENGSLSKWIREVEEVRDVEVELRLFRLQLINDQNEDPLADAHVKGTPALRTLALVRREKGNHEVGRVYEALGKHIHEDPSEDLDQAALRASLEDAGLDPSIIDRALDDDSTMGDVRSEHEAAVSEVDVFGIPTLVLATGQGMFGPEFRFHQSRAPRASSTPRTNVGYG